MITGRIPFGVFELHRRLGRGGMGEVWRGVHREQGIPVAVKVVRRSLASSAENYSVFRNETRQAARLTHPGIVMVLDYGEVPLEAEDASGGELVSGSPYLVMEYASGGSIDQLGGPLPWRSTREILLRVLDALAHAHARGVLHRDIKPANILLADPDDLRPGLKLADLGLAHALRDRGEESEPAHAGTPHYMAPEQIAGLWREQGPWTDLYAVGCLAYELACGQVPFDADSWPELASKHLTAPIPEVRPEASAPEGFDAWMRMLLAKHPRDRYQRAADAAWGLASLPEPEERAVPLGPLEVSPSATFLLAETLPLDEDIARGLPDREGGGPRLRPPLPETWGRAAPPPPPPRLVGAGLGLYDLRDAPMVGRTVEAERAWAALRAVDETQQPRAVVIRGPAGFGKSRLAWAVAERAHEVGGATTLLAVHGSFPTPLHGLGGMVARHFHCIGLDPQELGRQLRRLAGFPGMGGRDEVDSIWRYLLFASGTNLMGACESPFAQPERRFGLVAQFLSRLGAERPVVLVLEDVQWGADTIAFVEDLLARSGGHDLPVLALLTCRDEDLAVRPRESEALGRLESSDGVDTLHLGPLGPRDQAELVGQLLALEVGLARRLQRRCGGNPLFLTQLVGDWVRRGVLVAGEDGFQLAEGADAALPDDLHLVWNGWMDAVLGPGDGEARTAVQLAAVLGGVVRADEWTRAAAHLGVEVPPEAAEALLAARLWAPLDDGWAFVHGMLRESLGREAAEAGHLERLHRAAAEMLRAAPQQGGTSARLGRHLLASGDLAGSLEPLHLGSRDAACQGDHAETLELVDLRESVMDRLQLPPRDIRRGENDVVRIQVFLDRGEFAAADRLAGRCIVTARRSGWAPVEVKALRARAMAAAKQGDLSVAEGMFMSAERLASRIGAEEDVAACLEHRGTVARMQGDRSGSLEHLGRARTIYEDLGFERRTADCLREIGGTLVTFGEVEEAEAALREAIDRYDRVGDVAGSTTCLNNLGDVLRRRGDLHGAEEAYQQALVIMERTGSHARVFPLANLSLARIARGRWDAALESLEEALDLAGATGRRWLEGALHAALLPCLAETGAWEAFDRHLEMADRLLAETGYVDADVAWVADLAAASAEAAGHRARADLARDLAAASRATIDPTAS